ncbi:MAG: hypothetical protein IPK87_11530 [Planctomycetes bacterium]|nr:hypothetical protein [Planctomycetota bacterium]
MVVVVVVVVVVVHGNLLGPQNNPYHPTSFPQFGRILPIELEGQFQCLGIECVQLVVLADNPRAIKYADGSYTDEISMHLFV